MLIFGASQLALASCSNMREPELIARTVQPVAAAAPASRVQASVLGESDDAGSVLSASSPSKRTEGGRSNVTQDTQLFSKSEDLKPWPKIGTKEWEDQQAKDMRRQQRLDEVTKICRDC